MKCRGLEDFTALFSQYPSGESTDIVKVREIGSDSGQRPELKVRIPKLCKMRSQRLVTLLRLSTWIEQLKQIMSGHVGGIGRK